MTKTIQQHRSDISQWEARAAQLLALSQHNEVSAFGTGVKLGKIVSALALLDLATKGALPEGSVGRIMRVVGEEIDAAERRVLVGTQAKMSGTELPPAGQ